MIPDRGSRGAVSVQVLERDKVEVYGQPIVKTRVVVGNGVPRVIYHIPGTPDQDLAELAQEIDEAKSWLTDPATIRHASIIGTTPSREIKGKVTRSVAALRAGNYSDPHSVFSSLIDQRALRRLYREGRKNSKAA
jgi:hypothetical protein